VLGQQHPRQLRQLLLLQKERLPTFATLHSSQVRIPLREPARSAYNCKSCGRKDKRTLSRTRQMSSLGTYKPPQDGVSVVLQGSCRAGIYRFSMQRSQYILPHGMPVFSLMSVQRIFGRQVLRRQ